MPNVMGFFVETHATLALILSELVLFGNQFFVAGGLALRDLFEGVRVFVEVVEAGGFAKAAARLSLTRSAVGKTIARLEGRLGVRLFNRTTRTQSLTDQGQQYYDRCKRAIEELRVAERLLEVGFREVTGRLKVTAPVLFGRRQIAPLLRAFARQHAGLELELCLDDGPLDVIVGEFDLAVREGTSGGNKLHHQRLTSQRNVLCAAPSYLRAKRAPDVLTDLFEHDLLIHWRHDRAAAWRLPNEAGELVDVNVTSRLRFNDLEVIAEAATEGMGLAWLPRWLVGPGFENGELIELWADRQSEIAECFAVWPVGRSLPLRSRLAIDALARELPKRC